MAISILVSGVFIEAFSEVFSGLFSREAVEIVGSTGGETVARTAGAVTMGSAGADSCVSLGVASRVVVGGAAGGLDKITASAPEEGSGAAGVVPEFVSELAFASMAEAVSETVSEGAAAITEFAKVGGVVGAARSSAAVVALSAVVEVAVGRLVVAPGGAVSITGLLAAAKDDDDKGSPVTVGALAKVSSKSGTVTFVSESKPRANGSIGSTSGRLVRASPIAGSIKLEAEALIRGCLGASAAAGVSGNRIRGVGLG